jgi:hypothetical protein
MCECFSRNRWITINHHWIERLKNWKIECWMIEYWLIEWMENGSFAQICFDGTNWEIGRAENDTTMWAGESRALHFYMAHVVQSIWQNVQVKISSQSVSIKCFCQNIKSKCSVKCSVIDCLTFRSPCSFFHWPHLSHTTSHTINQ